RGGHIVVGGLAAKQHIAHAAAGQVGRVASATQGLYDARCFLRFWRVQVHFALVRFICNPRSAARGPYGNEMFTSRALSSDRIPSLRFGIKKTSTISHSIDICPAPAF